MIDREKEHGGVKKSRYMAILDCGRKWTPEEAADVHRYLAAARGKLKADCDAMLAAALRMDPMTAIGGAP